MDFLLGHEDPGDSVRGGFFQSEVQRDLKDDPQHPLWAKLKPLVVVISEEYLRRSYQFGESMPACMYGPVEKLLSNTTWY